MEVWMPILFVFNLSPLQGKKLLVIGTTSELGFLDSIGFCDTFSVTYNVPTLKTLDAKKVIINLLPFWLIFWLYIFSYFAFNVVGE